MEVFPNTKIEARSVSISGQTHKDSFVKCVNADINILKGKIVGRKIVVKELQDGVIIADTAIVENATAGKIRAKTVEINVLGSHLTIEASGYI